jgi:hypothetical protein
VSGLYDELPVAHSTHIYGLCLNQFEFRGSSEIRSWHNRKGV